jgi:serine/threonine protein kinase
MGGALPEEMSSNKERLARFYREARPVAALNHPNIITLYSVEESNGMYFLTMSSSLASRSVKPPDRLAQFRRSTPCVNCSILAT